jgi:hypothetical protein
VAYIRSTSNPEALYSWADIDGNTYFSWKGNLIGIPTEKVNQFFRELYKFEVPGYGYVNEEEPFVCGDIGVVEFQEKTGEITIFGDEDVEFKIKLSFGAKYPELIMWRSTWEYLKTNFYQELIGWQTFRTPWYRLLMDRIQRWYSRLSTIEDE